MIGSTNSTVLENKIITPEEIGAVKLNQGSENAGKILVVDADGDVILDDMPEDGSGAGGYVGPEEPTDENVMIWVDTNENSDDSYLTKVESDARYISMIKKVGNPHNLLDNSDFRSPVNQRGVLTTTAWQYCLDRWAARVSDMTLNTSIHGITITRGTSDGNNYIYQKISNYDRLLGKTVTYAAMINDELLIGSMTVPTSLNSEWTQLSNVVSKHGYSIGMFNPNNLNLCMSVGLDGAALTSATFKWAVLYEGEYTFETLPEYQPKGYGVELANCTNSYADSTDTYANGATMHLLWENASPSSSFTAQTISLDLSKYELIMILGYYTAGDIKTSSVICRVGDNFLLAFAYAANSKNINNYRHGTTSNTGVTFNPGWSANPSSDTENNASTIPYRIYGVMRK